jgi:hypothetical protein
MDVALRCAQCGTTVVGRRFCTTCGAPLAEAASVEAQPVAADPGEASSASGPWDSTTDRSTTTSVLPAPGPAGSDVPPPWLSGQPTSTPTPTPTSTSTRTHPNVVALLVVGALALSAWAIVRGVEEHTLSGTVLLVDSPYFGLTPGARCSGDGGYGDLRGGAQVVLADERGDTLSTGRLSAGEFDGLGCVFSFALEDVARADFYSLTVAGGHRGQLQYSYDELADGDWSVQLSIGDD